MKEINIDISGNKTKSVFDLSKQKRIYDYVITVCDDANSEKCPLFPALTQRLHWPFEDPARFEGTREERLNKTRKVRDKIKRKIEEWLTSSP
jgi:arsenate reductase